MSAIWFSGTLDHAYTLNPVQLRGYDASGNLLWSIRTNDIRDHDFLALANSPASALSDFQDPYFFAPGFDHYGNAVTLVTTSFTAGVRNPRRQPIQQFAVGRDGRIYCAFGPSPSSRTLKPGVTEGQVRDIRQYVSVQPYQSKYHGIGVALTIPAGDPNVGYDDLTVYPYQNYVTGVNGEPFYIDLYCRYFAAFRQGGDRIEHPELHGRPVYAVAANDAEGGFYLAGEPSGAGEIFLRKYNAAFAQQWSAPIARWWPTIPYYTPPPGFGVDGWYTRTWEKTANIVLDAAGDVYLAGHYESYSHAPWAEFYPWSYTSGWLRKYSGATGVLLWERRFGPGVTNLATDGTTFYLALRELARQYRIGDTAHYFRGDQAPCDILAWDPAGALVGTAATPHTITIHNQGQPNQSETIARSSNVMSPLRVVASGGRLYVSHKSAAFNDPANNPKFLLVYDTATMTEVSRVPALSDQIYLMARNPVDKFTDFAFDAAGNQYFPKIGLDLLTPNFMAFTPAAARLWEPKTADGLSQANSRAAVWDGGRICIVASPHLPALQLGLALGVPAPVGDRYVLIPGLPLPLGLGAPSVIREYVGPARPIIYRLFLRFATAVELPFSSRTLRRTAGGRQLSAVAVAPDIDTLQAIEAAPAVMLAVMRGVLLPGGIEQADELLSLPLYSMRADLGPRRFSVSLEGRGAETPDAPRARTIKGVSYRALIDGRRRARADVDPLIKPGDTALLDSGESFVVGEITITLTPTSAVMEVAEI